MTTPRSILKTCARSASASPETSVIGLLFEPSSAAQAAEARLPCARDVLVRLDRHRRVGRRRPVRRAHSRGLDKRLLARMAVGGSHRRHGGVRLFHLALVPALAEIVWVRSKAVRVRTAALPS